MNHDLSYAPDRMLRQLRGEGIEIGALQTPQFLPYGKVHYIDVLSRKEALRYFPEVPASIPVIDPDTLSPADQLTSIESTSQDFVIASHLLEHTEDPIAALKEWHRVLKPGALLYLCLPNKLNTFDSERKRTTLDHLIGDHAAREKPSELVLRNQDHYKEWGRYVNHLSDEKQIAFWAELLQTVHFPIHFHCWVPEDIEELLAYLAQQDSPKFDIIDREQMRGDYEFAFLLQRPQA